MKKIFCYLLLIFALFTFTSCDKKDDITQTNTSEFNFNTKVASEEEEDGWVYFFTFDYGKKEINMENQYHFDAYNLKYSEIDGYEIPVIDEDTGKVEQRIKPNLPYLNLNKEFSNDIDNISKYFSKQKFTDTIKLKDLDGLSLTKISKKQVLQLFNKAIENGKLPDGKYGNLPEADLKKEKAQLDGYQWQVAYFNSHGNIINIKIELIYNQNEYLSDLYKNNELNTNQQKIYDEIEKIEKEILNQQKFTVINKDSAQSFGKVEFLRLYMLLEQIESGEN